MWRNSASVPSVIAGACLTRSAGSPPPRAVRSSVGSPGRPPSPATPPIFERRQVTSLFCELVEYNELASHFDPELVHDIVGSYVNACGGVIDRFGGHVLRLYRGGGVAAIGHPR